MTGHPALAAAVDVLARHEIDDDGACRCGTDRAVPGWHHEHFAEQLAIAGVLKGGAPT